MLILWVTYLPPGENHENLIQNLIEKITRIKSIYETINIILFGDLNIKRNEIEKKLGNKLKGGKNKFNLDKNLIKIYGNNIRTLNESF